MAAASYAPPKANRLRFPASTPITACLGGPSDGRIPIRMSLETSPRAITVVELRQSVINRYSAVKAIEELVRKSQTHPTIAAPRIATSSKPIGSSHDDVARRLSTTRRTAICAVYARGTNLTMRTVLTRLQDVLVEAAPAGETIPGNTRRVKPRAHPMSGLPFCEPQPRADLALSRKSKRSAALRSRP